MADDETLAYIRERVADEAGVPPEMAHRLHGANLAELRADARTLRAELGMPALEDAARDERGRFSAAAGGDMNRIIRAASGRA
jgi:hypothetical protein